MNRLRARFLLLPLLPLVLSGCGYLFGDSGMFRDNSRDYRLAEEQPPIRLPEDSEVTNLDEIYPIPPISDDIAPAPGGDVPRPVPLLTGSAAQLVRIQRLGDDSWALIGMPPGQLWPQVRGFLAAANMGIARQDARAGLIESSWLELQGQDLPARFRFRVERGVQRGNSELHVLQMYRGGEDSDWPGSSDNLELEGEMLRSVAQFIANTGESGGSSVSMMVEQSISPSSRVDMIENRDGQYLRLELPFDRAWASIARALDQSGFEISDRNRSEGRYYVAYRGSEDEERGGLFGWFGGGKGEDHPLAGVPMLLDVRETQPGVLAIHLEPEGAPVSDETALKRLLQLIEGNLN